MKIANTWLWLQHGGSEVRVAGTGLERWPGWTGREVPVLGGGFDFVPETMEHQQGFQARNSRVRLAS